MPDTVARQANPDDTWFCKRSFKKELHLGVDWHGLFAMEPHPLDTFFNQEQEASAFGLSWPNVEMLLDQIRDECREVQEAISQNEGKERLQEEVGDLIHAALTLCILLDIDIQETLIKTNTKFASRLEKVKKVAHSLGLSSLKGQSFESMMAIWHKAKAWEG